jgi:hypothetical protein
MSERGNGEKILAAEGRVCFLFPATLCKARPFFFADICLFGE